MPDAFSSASNTNSTNSTSSTGNMSSTSSTSSTIRTSSTSTTIHVNFHNNNKRILTIVFKNHVDFWLGLG
jgi:hypothetical protein